MWFPKSINSIPTTIACFQNGWSIKVIDMLNISIRFWFKSYQHLFDKMIKNVQIFHLALIMMTAILVNLKLIICSIDHY